MSEDVARSDRVCVIGAGPSGLATARQLREAGIPFDVHEKHSDVGGIWDPTNEGSPIYRTAHFISSRFNSGFYGHPMPDSYPDYPSWSQIRDYIHDFATDEKLYEYITFNSRVEHAELRSDGQWDVTVGGEQKRYRALAVATGVTWHASTPELKGQETFTGKIMHSSEYSDSSIFWDKKVLIVGAGNSGVDIACDAATSAERAFLSVRRGYRFIPKHIFGMPLDVFSKGGRKAPAGITLPDNMDEIVDALVGDVTRFGLPAPDHDLLTSHPIVNDQIIHHFNHGDITAKPDIDQLEGSDVVFKDGTREQIDVLLLATGYDYKIPFLDDQLFEWQNGRPQLYLNTFNRTVDSLYVVGFVEFADAAYKRFEEMAQLVAMDLTLEGAEKATFAEMKAHHQPDLRGGRHYVDSPRHANYVDTLTFQQRMREIRDQFGVDQLTDTAP
ncbi:flavin-containing monooxygenase [Gordonia rubripertincta]|uniref:NAD(P)-binding domain-containing protein n=1 Tax=Gordonia rubripertincta TaxID=36822 RepID=A0ABT4MWS6_GORRU|nr:NAD(P)-binding domain-containing protein [Gordonia rubripertincta]MCZ4551463.1 NAD(P)-binding domain-containing protein [Gordonia rubripertincta]